MLTGRDTLDTATACKTADRRLGDALDVVAQNLAVTLRTALSETLATLSTCDWGSATSSKEIRVSGETGWILTSSHDELRLGGVCVGW